MRSIEVHGTSMEGHQYDIWVDPVATALNRCSASFNTKSCAVANTLNASATLVEIVGDAIGANVVRNGSTISSYATSQFKVRANSGWMITEAVGTTAARPVGATVGQRYFDTTLGKPVWLKTAPSTWADATGATA
jgi:hypothetical protein